MSVLSKRWKHVLDTYPNLHFSWFDFISKDQALVSAAPSEEKGDKLENFMNYVDASLIRFCNRKCSLQKFGLFTILLPDPILTSIVDEWVRQVIENGVKEVEICIAPIGNDHHDGFYSLPEIVFAATLLTTLILAGCYIELKDSFCITLHSLRKLELTEVHIDDHVFSKLVSCCVLLEDISLSFCTGLKKILVSGLPGLKTFKVWSYTQEPKSIEIVSPSLESSAFMFDSQLVKHIIKVDACQGLKSLYLSGFIVTKPFHHMISKFPVLESLVVCDCSVLESVKISSRSLKSLQIIYCNNIEAIEMDTPNLLSCRYCGSIVPLSVINAPSCEWQVEFKVENIINILWYMKLKAFIVQLNQLVYLHIHVGAIKISFNLEDFSSTCSPSVVENVVLTIAPAFTLSEYSPFMDGLFCYFRPNNLFIRAGNCQTRYVEYLSDFLKRGDLSCCNHGKVKCWRHDLKGVKVENFQDFADRTPPYYKMISATHLFVRSHSSCKMEWRL